jgi:hypothetical protein
VAKNDRHRQIINANVYEKESQNRAKAIEETRQRKQDVQRRGEKSRFQDFLHKQQLASGSDSNAPAAANEITLDGIRFRVLDGGKKLAKITGSYPTGQEFSNVLLTNGITTDGSNDLAPTPKSTVVAGVKFHRTKTGNLVANRIVRDQRYVQRL